MKLIALFVLVFATVASQGQTNTVPPKAKPHPHTHILRVLEARKQAILDAQKQFGKKLLFQPVVYQQELAKIEPTGCPKEFMLKWMDYQESWRGHINDSKHKGERILMDLAKMTISAAVGNVAGAGSAVVGAAADAGKPLADTSAAWFQVRKACVILDTPPGENDWNF